MKYYLRFYNNENKENYYIYDDSKDYLFNTNLNYFDLKIFSSEISIDYSRITNYKIVIEKETNGIYSIENVFYGEKKDEYIKFEKCYLNKELDYNKNTKYKVYIELLEGGITVYSSLNKYITLVYKSVCDDFNIDIYNSKYIGDTYELQDDEILNISFSINIDNNDKNNTLKYYYTFDYNENVDHKDFLLLSSNNKEFNYIVATNIFKDECTYLHFYLKDSFNNIRYKKYKIITKNKVIEIFDVVDYNEKIIDSSSKLSFFYNEKNINIVTPKLYITNNDSTITEYVSERKISLSNNTKQLISFVISEYFNEIDKKLFNSKEIYISFLLNEGSLESDKLNLIYDNESPNLIINEIETDNYLLIKDDADYTKITGQIIDNNLFYIGNNKKIYDFEKMNKNTIIYSEEEIYFFKENEKYNKIQNKFDKYYYINSNTYDFELYNYNYEKINNYISFNDSTFDDYKIFFIYLNKNDFNTYELNLISNNEILIKENLTSFILKHEKFEINNYILFKVYLKKDFCGKLDIDIGIEDYDYNFIKYINKKNVSCNIDFDKRIDANFEKTNLIFANSNEVFEIITFNNIGILSTKTPIVTENISIIPVSLNVDEFYTTDKEIVFSDNDSNLKYVKDIYFKPTLKINDIPDEFDYFKINEIQSGMYSFEAKFKIFNKVNKYTIEVIDELNNKNSKTLTIEKENKNIDIYFDESYSRDIAFIKNYNEYDYNLYVNKSNLTFKLYITNETLLDIKNNEYITFNSNKNLKYKIIRDSAVPYVIVNLYNLNSFQSYEVFYSDSILPILKFSINVLENIYINVSENNISGNDCYFLHFKTNEFSKINIVSNNKNFKIEDISTDYNNRTLKVQRLSSNNIIDNVTINLSAYDEKNIFHSNNKNINILFYNDNIIYDYYIDDKYINKSNYINCPSFDLSLKVINNNYIKRIYYYDELEMDFGKRRKEAIIINGEFLIKDIVTPINESILKINIEISNGEDVIQISKNLFENNMIKLYDEIYDITVDYIQDKNKLIAKFKNNLNREKVGIEIYSNNDVIYKNESFILEKNENDIEIPIEKFTGKTIIYTKVLIGDKIINLNSCEINLLNYSNNVKKVNEINKYNVSSLNEEFNFNLYFNNNDDIIEVITPTLKKKYFKNNEVLIFDEIGVYILNHYIKSYKNNILIDTYYFDVVYNYNESIYIKNNSFIKYNFINEVILNNPINFNIDVFNPKIILYSSGEKIKEYYPYYFENNEMKFIVDKIQDNSCYLYNDNFTEKSICEFNSKAFSNDEFYLYSFNTKDESAFYINNNNIYIEKKTNLYFKSTGVSEIYIIPYNINKKIKKILIDDNEDVILSGFIPCTLEVGNGYDKKEYIIDIIGGTNE